MGYPCIRYHVTEPPRRVLTAEAEDALGPGWFDSPKKAAAAAVAPVDPPVVAIPRPSRSTSKKAAAAAAPVQE